MTRMCSRSMDISMGNNHDMISVGYKMFKLRKMYTTKLSLAYLFGEISYNDIALKTHFRKMTMVILSSLTIV